MTADDSGNELAPGQVVRSRAGITRASAGNPSRPEWQLSLERVRLVARRLPRRGRVRRERAQDLERAQALELLEVRAQERLDHLEDLAGALDLDELAGLGDRAAQQQRDPGQGVRRQRHD